MGGKPLLNLGRDRKGEKANWEGCTQKRGVGDIKRQIDQEEEGERIHMYR